LILTSVQLILAANQTSTTVLTARVVWVSTDRLRLLILIVAYNAESTLAPVLDRLPPAVLSDYDCEV